MINAFAHSRVVFLYVLMSSPALWAFDNGATCNEVVPTWRHLLSSIFTLKQATCPDEGDATEDMRFDDLYWSELMADQSFRESRVTFDEVSVKSKVPYETLQKKE